MIEVSSESMLNSVFEVLMNSPTLHAATLSLSDGSEHPEKNWIAEQNRQKNQGQSLSALKLNDSDEGGWSDHVLETCNS